MNTTGLLFRGQRLRRAGQAAEAVEVLDRAAEAAPDSPHVALHRALALADAGRLDEALALLAEGAERCPLYAVFPLFHAALLIENDRFAEAAAPLQAARTLSPKNLLAEAYAALAQMRQGHIEEPLHHLAAVGFTENSRALAAILTEVEAVLFRRFGADTDPQPPAAESLPELDSRTRAKSAPRLAALGTAALEKGHAAEAYQLLSLAAGKNPSLANVQTHLGCACFDLGRHAEALDHFARVGDWSQMKDVLHLHRGACFYKLGRYDEALEALATALAADELGEYTTWVRFFQGRTFVAQGRVQEARAAFRTFVDLEGDMARARLRQGRELLGLAVAPAEPHGFQVFDEGRATLVVRPPYAAAVRERRSAEDGQPLREGRAPLQRIALPDGVGLVRHCCHGGLLGGLLRDLYLDGGRALRELAVSDALTRRGVPTPEMIGGLRERVFPGLYRMEIITREVCQASDLAEVLRALPRAATEAQRRRPLETAARLIAQLHHVGVHHPDLNARNILITPDGMAMVIDLDKVEMVDCLSARRRCAAVTRLYRSLAKLGLSPHRVTDEDWLAFLGLYLAEAPDLGLSADELLGRCKREVERHRLWWRLTRQPT